MRHHFCCYKWLYNNYNFTYFNFRNCESIFSRRRTSTSWKWRMASTHTQAKVRPRHRQSSRQKMQMQVCSASFWAARAAPAARQWRILPFSPTFNASWPLALASARSKAPPSARSTRRMSERKFKNWCTKNMKLKIILNDPLWKVQKTESLWLPEQTISAIYYSQSPEFITCVLNFKYFGVTVLASPVYTVCK